MTKEALKKEAIKYAVDYPTSYGKGYKHKDLRIAYLAGAKPREKQIAELGERCLQLQKDKGNLTDRVRDLEAQIEKMKCCFNCKHSRTEYEHCRTDKHEKWEIKEK